MDEVAKLWTSSGEAARRNIEKLVEKELEILATLQDGSAILEKDVFRGASPRPGGRRGD